MSFSIGVKDRLAVWEKNRGESIKTSEGIFYSDGSWRELDAMGAWVDPPNDPFKQAAMIAKFHEARLKVAVIEFDDRRELLKSQAEAAARDGYPPPPESQIAELKRLQAIVRQRRAAFNDARERHLSLKPDNQRLREENLAHNRARSDQFLDALKGIRV